MGWEEDGGEREGLTTHAQMILLLILSRGQTIGENVGSLIYKNTQRAS